MGWVHHSFLAAAFLMAPPAEHRMFSWRRCGAQPLLDELKCALILGHFEQRRGRLLVGSKATHLLGHVLHEVGVLGEAPSEPTLSQFADVLCHIVAPVEAPRPWGSLGPWLLLSDGDWGQEDFTAFQTQDECTLYSSVD